MLLTWPLVTAARTTREEAYRLVVMMRGAEDGAGIIFGRDGATLYVVTANHVLEGEDGRIINPTIKIWCSTGLRLQAISASAAAEQSDPTLDLAVVKVTFADRVLETCGDLAFDRLADPGVALTDQSARLLGYGNSESWHYDLQASIGDLRDDGTVEFQSNRIQKGDSGGALFNGRWEIIGLIQKKTTQAGIALPVTRVIESLKAWGYAPTWSTREPVKILAFSATPPQIEPGKGTRLEWRVRNASTCSIDGVPGTLPGTGNAVVTPTMNRDYTLSCEGTGGPVTSGVSVTVDRPVLITSFNSDKDRLAQGDSTMLRWTAENATSCTIDHDIGEVANAGSKAVSPASTTTYSIVCNGYQGPIGRSWTITMGNPPTIISFDATPKVTRGSGATLRWKAIDVTTCTIDQNIGSVSIEGERTVTLHERTRFTLKCIGGGKDVMAKAVVDVVDPVVISSFSPSPTSITLGQSATLSWQSSGATSCSIDPGFPNVGTIGSTSVTPEGTITYTLQCQGGGGKASALATITVNQPPVEIVNFSADKDGDNSWKLSWQTRNATGCNIDGQTVPKGGVIRDVSPARSTTFTLQCVGRGASGSKQVTITVSRPVSIVSFDANNDDIDRGDETTLTWSTQDADTCVINNLIGPVRVSGSKDVKPRRTTTYKLICKGKDGSTDSKEKTIRVAVLLCCCTNAGKFCNNLIFAPGTRPGQFCFYNLPYGQAQGYVCIE